MHANEHSESDTSSGSRGTFEIGTTLTSTSIRYVAIVASQSRRTLSVREPVDEKRFKCVS